MYLRNSILISALISLATPALAQPMPGQRIPRSDPNGAYCREYQQTVIIGGKKRDSYGTACMQPDGDWKILPSDAQQYATEDTVIEYIEEPRYVSAPVYMVPPPMYYEPIPYYRSYPYGPRYGSRFSIEIGSDYHHRGHHHWRRHH